MDKKGFTLVELIVVVLLIAILAAIVIPTGLGYVDEKKKDECAMNRKALLSYFEVDKMKNPGVRLGETIGEPGKGQNDKRELIQCPSGGTYTEQDGNKIYCTVHGGGEWVQESRTAPQPSGSPVTAP